LAEGAPSNLELARMAVELARRAGADECDSYLAAFEESEVTVRKGETEKVIEAGSRSLGLRAIVGGRTAVCSTSDLRPEALDAFARETVELARISEPDEFAGLPDAEQLFRGRADGLGLYDEAVETLSTDEMMRMAGACEAAAFAADARITNSDGASVSRRVGEVVLANSLGFASSYPVTSVTLMVEVMADDADGKKRNAYWFATERRLQRLTPGDEVGRIAARRAVDQIGARKVSTRQVPVIFEPMMAASLAGSVAGCATGGALYRRSTFLAERLGQQLGSDLFTLVDDPTEPGGRGSRPFDGEGVASRRTEIFAAGRFNAFLFDCYTARRCGATTTGSAARSIEGSPSPSAGNLSLLPGKVSAAEIVADVKEGLYVTALMGQGFNPTTGDYSRGAAGFWIENGKLAFPVTEVNISGRMDAMLAAVDAVGDDFEWFGGTGAPTVRVREMTVSGL
jgi:PmbA protein